MKILLIVVLAVFLLPYVAFAQTQEDDPTRCFVSDPSQLRAGMTATLETGANLRSAPSIFSDVLAKFKAGDDVLILEDPVCYPTSKEGFIWVKVQAGNLIGYMAEVGGNGYHLIPKDKQSRPLSVGPLYYGAGPLYQVLPEATDEPHGSCQGAQPSRLILGEVVYLAEGIDYISLRDEPQGLFLEKEGTRLRLLPGQTLTLTKGPICMPSPRAPEFLIPWWGVEMSVAGDADGIVWFPELQGRRNDSGNLEPEYLVQVSG